MRGRFPHGRAIAKIVSIELLECNRSGTALTSRRKLWRRGFQFDSDYSGGRHINTFFVSDHDTSWARMLLMIAMRTQDSQTRSDLSATPISYPSTLVQKQAKS